MLFRDAVSIIKELKSGKISPIYLLHGEEGFYIDQLTNWIENNLLPEAERSFNQEVLYGKDIDENTIYDYARQFPMMSQYRVIIVKEAQHVKLEEKFEAYVNSPNPTTVLVIAHKGKKIHGRKKYLKTAKDKYVVLESNAIKEYQLGPWIVSYLKNKGYKINNDATALVAEYLGTDLSKLSNELEKLTVNVDASVTIGLKEVEANIGISKDYNVFELQEAIVSKDYGRTFRIVENFQANMKKNPMEVVVGSLFSYFQRLYIVRQNIGQGDAYLSQNAGINPYFLKKTKTQAKSISERGYRNAFKVLSDYDGRTKGVQNRSTSREELLKEMVGKLLLVR